MIRIPQIRILRADTCVSSRGRMLMDLCENPLFRLGAFRVVDVVIFEALEKAHDVGALNELIIDEVFADRSLGLLLLPGKHVSLKRRYDLHPHQEVADAFALFALPDEFKYFGLGDPTPSGGNLPDALALFGLPHDGRYEVLPCDDTAVVEVFADAELASGEVSVAVG